MFVPIRVLNPIRGDVAPGLVLSMASATAVLGATPLLLPELAEGFGVSAGVVGLVSAVQLAGFVVTSFFSGRFVTASSRLFVVSTLTLAAANVSSAIVDHFALLLASRALAGLALGALSWMAWSQVFGDPEGMGDIAVVGPIAGVIASPIFGLLIEVSSYRWVFVALALAAIGPLASIPQFNDQSPQRNVRTKGGAPAAYAMVSALGLLTMGASSVFIYSGVIGRQQLAMSASTLSLLFAGNAAAGIPSARWRGKRPAAGFWFAICGILAIAITTTSIPAVLGAAVVVWGFLFWFATPAAYRILSERSLFPAERAGDAQAAMAFGRILGPLFGGAMVSTGSFATLGFAGGGVIIGAGLIMLFVEYGIRSSPTRS